MSDGKYQEYMDILDRGANDAAEALQDTQALWAVGAAAAEVRASLCQANELARIADALEPIAKAAEAFMTPRVIELGLADSAASAAELFEQKIWGIPEPEPERPNLMLGMLDTFIINLEHLTSRASFKVDTEGEVTEL